MVGDNYPEKPSRQKEISIVSYAGYALELIILTTTLLIEVVWATNKGTLPGDGIAEGVLWACMYAGLFMFYHQYSLEGRRSARSLMRRLGFSLLLAVASTHVFKVLVSPEIWHKFYYLRYISIPAIIALCCVMLLPLETKALHRSARTSKIVAPFLSLAILIVASAFLVSLTDFVIQIFVTSSSNPNHAFIQRNAWATTILILLSAYTLAYSVTSKMTTALLLVSPVYVIFGIATIAKWKYMHTFVTPLDLLRVPEFLPQFRIFFGTGVLVATVCGLIAWLAGLIALWRVPSERIPVLFRVSIGVFSLLILLAVPVAYTQFRYIDKFYRTIGSPVSHEKKDFTSGYLLNFLADTPTLFLAEPPNYSQRTVAMASQKYLIPDGLLTTRGRGRRVNLIVYLVESFMDPEDLGWRYTSDPIPNARLLKKTGINGHAFVPEIFGASANTEFELLTGMSTIFCDRNLPYRQLMENPIPSLPRTLKQHGYRTVAVQADPKHFYSREKAYSLLGFDNVVWLHGRPDIERAAQGWWPSDKAVVKSIIQASQQASPFFIFAFPSSTHSPYDHSTYRDSDLDVLDLSPGSTSDEIKYYINALRVADRAIGALIEHFRGQPDPTMIAIMGDHLPPLTDGPLRLFNEKLATISEAEKVLMLHRVPFLVWTNFDIPRERIELSTNSIPSYLLEKMGIPPHGFFSVSDAVRRKLPILKFYARGVDGSTWNLDSLPNEERSLIADYRLLQHDLLIGKQYSIRSSTSGLLPPTR